MGRNPRQWLPGTTYHITNRGNQKANLFHDDDDFVVFLRLLQHARRKTPYHLYAYCLMSNHYHLLLSSDETPLSQLMAWINKRYANYFNNRYGLSGHVFEKRFYSHSVTEGHGLAYVSRYIHINPVTANLVQDPADYPWSSYHQYLYNLRETALCPVDITKILKIYPGKAAEKRSVYQRFVEK